MQIKIIKFREMFLERLFFRKEKSMSCCELIFPQKKPKRKKLFLWASV